MLQGLSIWLFKILFYFFAVGFLKLIMYVNFLNILKNDKMVKELLECWPVFYPLFFQPLSSVLDPTEDCSIGWNLQIDDQSEQQLANIPTYLHFQEKNVNLFHIALH